MRNFIEVTVADGCKAFVPVSNIEYVAELKGYENSNTTIYFIAGNKCCFDVRETFSEVVALIEAATAPLLPPHWQRDKKEG